MARLGRSFPQQTRPLHVPASGSVLSDPSAVLGNVSVKAAGTHQGDGAGTPGAATVITMPAVPGIVSPGLMEPGNPAGIAQPPPAPSGQPAMSGNLVITASGTKNATGSSKIQVTGSMLSLVPVVQVTNAWVGSMAAPAAPSGIPPPAPASVNVTTASVAGRWLVAVAAWRQAPGYPAVDFHLEDSAHNWWEPMGAPGGTSTAAGDVRVAVWRAPAAKATTLVAAAPTGFVLSAAVTVLEFSGPLPWVTERPTSTTFQASGTSLPALPGAATATNQSVLWVTAMARDLNTVTTTVPAGWSQGPMASAGDGLDHNSDVTLMTAWQQTTGNVSATWAGNASCGMAGIVTGFLVQGTSPTQANVNWPTASFAIAPGAGVATPASQITWTDVDTAGPTPRFFDFQFTQGQEYEVDSLQAGQGQVTLGDPDLGLMPPGTGAFKGVDSGTPWRLLLAWPGTTPWYAVRGLFERMPQSWDSETWYGWVQATILDSWAYCQAQMQSSLRQEILADSPADYWPLGDPAGSIYASNLAPGSTSSLIQVTSPYGTAGATAAFGASAITPTGGVTTTSGGLPGDTGTVWQQDGLPAVVTNAGFCLYCQSSAFPALNGSAGASVESWHALTDTAPGQNVTLQAIKGSKGLIWRVYADVNGALWITTQDVAGTQVTTSLGTATWLAQGMFQVCVTWLPTSGWTVYVNGAKAASSASAPNLAPTFSWIEVAGESDRFGSGNCYDGQAAHVAIFGQVLPAARIASHYQAGATGMQSEPAPSRIERLLSYGGYTSRRVIETSAVVDECASLSDLGTTPAGTPVNSGTGQPYAAGAGTVQAGQEIAATVASALPAMIYIPPTGAVYYHAKGNAFGEAVKWVLGDRPDLGEIPLEDDLGLDWDPQRVQNLIQITQSDRQDVVSPQALNPNAAGAVTQAASQDRYGTITSQNTGYLNRDVTTAIQATNPSGLIDLANWLANSYATPHQRVQQVTVDATAKPSLAMPLVLGVSPGDLATVNHRPPQAGGAVVSLTGRITQVQRTLSWGGKDPHPEAKAVLVIDFCPELNPLTLNDPVLGELSGVPTLTWLYRLFVAALPVIVI